MNRTLILIGALLAQMLSACTHHNMDRSPENHQLFLSPVGKQALSPDDLQLRLAYKNLTDRPMCVALEDMSEAVARSLEISPLPPQRSKADTNNYDQRFRVKTNASNAIMAVPPYGSVSEILFLSDYFKFNAGEMYKIDLKIAVLDCRDFFNGPSEFYPLLAADLSSIQNLLFVYHGDIKITPESLDLWAPGFSKNGMVVSMQTFTIYTWDWSSQSPE